LPGVVGYSKGMSQRVEFDIDCPNNHNQSVAYSHDEFEKALAAGLEFHCNTCDTNWPPSHQDIAKIRRALAKTSS